MHTSRFDLQSLTERTLEFEASFEFEASSIHISMDRPRETFVVVLDREHCSRVVMGIELGFIELVNRVRIQRLDVHLVDVGPHRITDCVVSV